MKRHLGCIVGVLAVAAFSSGARASVSAFLTSTSGGSPIFTTWDYTLRFTPSITGETLTAGDFVTLYDYAPDITSAIATGWAGTVHPTTGVTPVYLLGAAGLVDSPTFPNVTFTYTGPTITVAQDFSATITTVSAYSQAMVSDGAGQSTAASGKYDTLFPVFGPRGVCCTSPEPGSLAMLCVAGLGLAARRRRGDLTR